LISSSATFCIGSVATEELNFTSTFVDLDGQETTSVFNLSSDAQSVPVNTNEPTEAQFVPSNKKSSQREGGSGRKRKQSHVGLALENYVEFKKIQNTETLETLKEHKRQEDQFSISKC
jgi:hypothetical protein